MAFKPLNWLLGFFSLDIGIDLGTANTLVNVRGKGITINEPSWVAIDKRTRQPLAIGAEAKEMVGRTPANVVAVRPLRDGVISEFEITQAMLEYFIGKAHEQSIVPVPRPRVIVGIPSGVTEVEKRAVYDAAMSAGAREVGLIEEPVAAALGAGLPVNEVRGSHDRGYRRRHLRGGDDVDGRRGGLTLAARGRRRDGPGYRAIHAQQI